MDEFPRQTTSIWMATAEIAPRSPLPSDMHADVCIVGAGIAGLTTAYMLAREGWSVVVLEMKSIGGGMTGRTTAHLTNAVDDRYYLIEHLHGTAGSHMTAESHTAAINCVETIVEKENIACDFERLDGYLFAPPGDDGGNLRRELAAAHDAGLASVEMVARAPMVFFDTGPCLRFPRQGQFHPLKYLAGLAEAVERRGGRIYTGTRVTTVQGGETARVETESGHTVTAGAVVVATNVPINDRIAVHIKQAPYTTYALGATVPHGTVARALYWDTLDPYHYVRLYSLPDNPGTDLLIVGGEDHRAGQADDGETRLQRVAAWARERFPMIQNVEYYWSGQVLEPVDGVAFIGRNPGNEENVYIATGDSGMGMTHGTIAGILLTELIAGRRHPWAALYDPSRRTLRATGEFLRENLNVAAQYAEDYLTGGDVGSADDLIAGEGALLRQGLIKVAAYRDLDGTLYQCSAECPHLGCVVHWNSLEKTWDCPCHGSRFDPYGRVLRGPATQDLERIEGN
ncbi:MAG TPA: FAD-dependent oxidoreductase [Candidatus Kapabacteria bacterium]|nr:FAD-dependent oxidoreductase [Candidatus Kapabacteria bacterium]